MRRIKADKLSENPRNQANPRSMLFTAHDGQFPQTPQ
jgi:hypothetical protein